MVPKQIIYPIRYSMLCCLKDPELEAAKFQSEFCHRIDPYSACLPLGRARTGIYLFVKQFLRSGRSKVILSPYTIPDVVNMVIFAGGQPVFVDALPRSTNIDMTQLAELIDSQTACVMITHYHVNQNQYSDIVSLCRQRDVGLFEDCAIALGGEIEGASVGAASAGGIFSLSAFKFLNFIWGGVILTRHPELHQDLKQDIAQWPRLSRRDYLPALVRTLAYDLSTRPGIYRLLTAPLLRHRQRHLDQPVTLKAVRLESSELDRTLTSTPSVAALAEWNRKSDRVPIHLEHRRQIASVYAQHLSGLMVASETCQNILTGSCFVNYPIVVGAERRDSIYKRLLLLGYDVGLSLYPNVHAHPRFKDQAGYSTQIDHLTRSVITLPTHPRVTVADAESLSQQVLALL
jgi:perosamine synthetase